MAVKRVHMGAARVAADLGDGSERGEYVSQDYILKTLGRPHRAVNLMYCYYPLDAGWPARASALPLPDGGKAGFAWDFAYDDYFPYQGGPGGSADGEPFAQMRDVRRHGQDVILTLTVDCAVPDSHLERIADELRPFGRLMLRINHEATGNWFAFNKRYSYQEVADFFVRFHNIVKKRAPHIRTVLCIGEDHQDEEGKMPYEDEFARAIEAADIWSTDTYLALHWGWPYDVAEPDGKTHKRSGNGETLKGFLYEYGRFNARSGGANRPFVISEFNADGDVTGPFGQAEQLSDFYRRLPDEAPCVTGITLYQFRDRGRLGLEIEDPNNPEVGHPQPALEEYRKILNSEPYLPVMTEGENVSFPAALRWGGSEDADGLSFPLRLEKPPVFCEVTFGEGDENLNLMLELRGRWFYKKPGVRTVDLMSAFFSGDSPEAAALRVFAPPPDGVNDPAQGDNWEVSYAAAMQNPPAFRVRYAPAAEPKNS